MITPKLFRESTAIALEAAVNVYLAPLSGVNAQRVIGANLDVKANVPFFNGNLYCDLTTDDTAVSAQTAPFVFKVFTASIEDAVLGLANAFIAANPTYFFSQIFAIYRPENPNPNLGVLVGVFYCTDPAASANWFSTGSGGGGSVLYTNAAPVPFTIGGIAAGSTFLNQTMQQMWDALLYPYLAPTFSSFSLSAIATILEVGDVIPAAVTFLWGTTNPANIVPNSLFIDDVTLAIPLAAGLADDGSEAVLQPGPVTSVVVASHTYRITGQNTNLAFFLRNAVYNWRWRAFYGTGVFSVPTEAQIEALASSALTTGYPGTYAYAAGGYKFLCVSDALGGQINSVKDQATLFNVAMADVTADPAYSNVDGGGFSYALVSVTNGAGVTSNYRVYRTYNTLGGAITLLVT